MRSGELARLSGVSSDTLRHYERLGLLPKPRRTNGGYRDYPAHMLDRVRLIRSALSIGFSLADLTAIMKLRDRGEFPCREARAVAESKLRNLKQQIKEMITMRKQLEQILENWDARLARTDKGKPARLLESLPEGLKRSGLASRFQSKRSKGK